MKPTVIDPKTTTRAAAFDLWMSAPNPVVTFFKTLDVTPLVRFSRKHGLKFNMLLCWCIGKAASVDTEIDGAVGMNSGIFNNPFIIWGKYHKGLFRTTLKLSFQFHHTQMDGAHAGRFLELLQSNINEIIL